MWAVLGLLALVAAWQMVMQACPEWHLVARAAAGILAFNMVYWLRADAGGQLHRIHQEKVDVSKGGVLQISATA